MMVLMRCERCPDKEATVKVLDVRTNADGRTVHVTDLCAPCARTAGIVVPHAPRHPEMLQMLAKAILPSSAVAPTAPSGTATNPVCPDCGWTLRDLNQTSRFGCPRDYTVFGAQVPELLDRLQGFSKHCDPAEESELDRLGAEMHEAIAREEYEAAARLRDRIRNLEASLEREDVLD